MKNHLSLDLDLDGCKMLRKIYGTLTLKGDDRWQWTEKNGCLLLWKSRMSEGCGNKEWIEREFAIIN